MSGLEMWVVYDHPKDFPSFFVARKWTVEHEAVRTLQLILSVNYSSIEATMKQFGLTRLNRSEGDDEKIKEMWI
jgi:hypothetical protein